MKTKAIDFIIKTIECKADEVGYNIDENTDYRRMCQIVTDFDYEGKVPTYEEKVFCAELLEDLCTMVGLRYDLLLDKAIGEYATPQA